VRLNRTRFKKKINRVHFPRKNGCSGAGSQVLQREHFPPFTLCSGDFEGWFWLWASSKGLKKKLCSLTVNTCVYSPPQCSLSCIFLTPNQVGFKNDGIENGSDLKKIEGLQTQMFIARLQTIFSDLRSSTTTCVDVRLCAFCAK
jgi:hypothetical protein